MQRAWLALSGVTLLAFGVWVVLEAYGTRRTPAEFQWWTNWSNVLALAAAVAIPAFGLLGRAVRRPRSAVVGEDQVRQALMDLAVRVGGDWAAEAQLREVTRPAPALVRWCSTGRPAASRRAVLNEAGRDWVEYPLRGQVDPLDPLNREIVDAVVGLPHRQLVVLGEPGAGKSVFAILLTLGLIRRRAQDERLPVPVLLPINLWDPTEPVERFVSRRLAEDYREVLAPYGDPLRLARRIVEHQWVLPILDGLDELPAAAYSQAVHDLDAFARVGQPLVLTCRVGEYEQAMRHARVLSRAAVIELAPVRVEDAITYLSEPPDPRWEPVFAHLRQNPASSLAQALATPLMVSLARIAYQDIATNPADLLSTSAAQSVSGRLMDAFLTAVYTTQVRRRGSSEPSRPAAVCYRDGWLWSWRPRRR